MSRAASVPPRLREAVERLIGGGASWKPVPGGSQGQLWCVRAGGVALAVKLHHHEAGFRRERAALEALRDLGPGLPALRFARDLAIVREWIEGPCVASLGRDSVERRRAHFQAGEFVRGLRRHRVEDDSISVEAAIRQRWSSWRERGADCMDPQRWRGLQERFRPDLFGGATRSWCHRDFEERNWIIDDSGRLRVLDLAQARPDLWLVDLAKLQADAWRGHASCAQHFYSGLGAQLNEDETRQLSQLVLLHAVQTRVWAQLHGDVELLALGDLLVRRALDELPVSGRPEEPRSRLP